MRNSDFRETLLVDEALRAVDALLPAGWVVEQRREWRSGGPLSGRVVDLVAGDASRLSFTVEARRSGSIPTAALLGGLRELSRQSAVPLLYVSDYIGPSLRDSLAREEISYVDATGWIRLTSEDPLILLTGQGADRPPRPARSHAVERMNGVATSRTVRALVTVSLPIGIRELADVADVSPGSISKLMQTLAAEGIVDRSSSGGVAQVRRRALIQRWVRDYAFTKDNMAVVHCIAPRGLERTLARLGSGSTPVALTGSAAARKMLPSGKTSVVPLRFLAVYAPTPAALVRELELIEADRHTANVVIAAPQDPTILSPTGSGLELAPVALVIADLLTLPNRSEAEAVQLMDNLERENGAWKA